MAGIVHRIAVSADEVEAAFENSRQFGEVVVNARVDDRNVNGGTIRQRLAARYRPDRRRVDAVYTKRRGLLTCRHRVGKGVTLEIGFDRDGRAGRFQRGNLGVGQVGREAVDAG